MREQDFRAMAFSFPEVVEAEHMGHPDFRVAGKIFATLDAPEKGWGMLKLPPAVQKELVTTEPAVFVPAQGAWGRQGCTHVRLRTAKKGTVSGAFLMAWRNVAPKKLVAAYDAQEG